MLQENIKNGLLSGGVLSSPISNNPSQYATRQFRYFDSESSRFIAEYGAYASDFVEAEVLGLYPDAPDEWTTAYIRFADAVRDSQSMLRKIDDYKKIIFVNPIIDYVREGTKFVTMGSTWLSINPSNISNSSGVGILRRCNTVWNYLDYYGNVKSEPLIIENARANANDSDDQEGGLITKGYFNVTCQYNEATKQLAENSRMILGTGAYRLTGFSDFIQEFTGDYSTVRLLEFAVRYEEPNDTIDDMVNHVAGGKTFSWNIECDGNTSVLVGATTTLTPNSTRNGENVSSTAENPISYLFTSENENIATVDENGVVTGIAEGEVSIIVSLEQNPSQFIEVPITVVTASADPYVDFLGTIPDSISMFDDLIISAAYFENGAQTAQEINFSFSGANRSAYSAIISNNTVILHCWQGSVEPLTITAKHGNYTNSIQINLLGL